MDGNLGTPVAYQMLRRGVPVYDRDGRPAGTVAHVLADEGQDVFHGLIVRTPDGGPRFADARQIAGLYENGVRLDVVGAALHDPAEDRVAAGATRHPHEVADALRRAWDWLSRPR